MAWDVATQSHLLARRGYDPRWLLYVWALETDRSSAPLGIWTGEYEATFNLGGSKTYQPGADGMAPDVINYETGNVIRTQRVHLNGVNETAQELVRGRIIRGRAAVLHLAFFEPIKGTLIGADRVFKGFVNRAPVSIGPHGKASRIEIELVSSMRMMTRPLGLLKSDESQKSRYPGDRFYRYGSVSSQVKTEWFLE